MLYYPVTRYTVIATVYCIRESLGLINFPFWKEFQKGFILFETNVELEHVVRRDVKNREKLPFQQEKDSLLG